MAAPYFILLAGYMHAWFRASVPDKPSCCCPERINTQTDGPNYLRMDFLHHLMCCYATFELFALYASRCPPVEQQFQAFEELLNGTDWLDFSGVNPSSSDSVHNGPHEWAARVVIILSHTVKVTSRVLEERNRRTSKLGTTVGGGARRRNVFDRIVRLTEAVVHRASGTQLQHEQAIGGDGERHVVDILELQSVFEWVSAEHFRQLFDANEEDMLKQECDYQVQLPEMIRAVAELDPGSASGFAVDFSGFVLLLRMMSSADHDVIASVIGTDGPEKVVAKMSHSSLLAPGQKDAEGALDERFEAYFESTRALRPLKMFLVDRGAEKQDGAQPYEEDKEEESEESDAEEEGVEEAAEEDLTGRLITALQERVKGAPKHAPDSSRKAEAKPRLPTVHSQPEPEPEPEFDSQPQPEPEPAPEPELDMSASDTDSEAETDGLLLQDVDVRLEPEPEPEPDTVDPMYDAPAQALGAIQAAASGIAGALTFSDVPVGQPVDENTIVYMSMVPTSVVALQRQARPLLESNRQDPGSMAMWSAGMDAWVEVEAEDLGEWAEGRQPQVAQRGKGLVLRILNAFKVFAATVAYVTAVIWWSVLHITPFSAVLAGLASMVTYAPGSKRVQRQQQFIRGMALVQWLFGIVGVTVTGEWEPYFGTWRENAALQQGFAWGTMLLVGMLQDTRRFDGGPAGTALPTDSQTASGDSAALFNRLAVVVQTAACLVLIGAGLYTASIVNLIYTVLGMVLLVWRVDASVKHSWSRKIWKMAFGFTTFVIVVSLALYIIPADFISRLLGELFGTVEDAGSANSDLVDDELEEFAARWNAWMSITGLRGCDQLELYSQANDTVAQSSVDALTAAVRPTECVAATFGLSYAILCTIGLYLWVTRAGSKARAGAEQDAATVAGNKKTLVEHSRLFRTMLRFSFPVLLFISAVAVSTQDTPTIPDSIVFVMLLAFVPNLLKLNLPNGRCLLVFFVVPLAVAAAATMFQYTSRIEQLECLFVVNMANANITVPCGVEHSTLGDCDAERVRNCVTSQACLRTSSVIDDVSDDIAELIGRNASTNSTDDCVLTPAELGLYRGSDQFWHNMLFLFIVFLYIATAKGFFTLNQLNQIREDPGATFARMVTRRIPPKYHAPLIGLHSAVRLVRIVLVSVAPHGIVLVTFANSQREVNCISAVYWLFTCWFLWNPRKAHEHWASLLGFASVCWLASYTWQFAFFRTFEEDEKWWPIIVGLRKIDELGEEGLANAHFTGHLWVVFALICVRRATRKASGCYTSENGLARQDIFCGNWSASPLYSARDVKLTVHNHTAAKVTLKRKGDVEVCGELAAEEKEKLNDLSQMAPCCTVLVRPGSVLKLQLDGQGKILDVIVGGGADQHLHVNGNTAKKLVGPLPYKAQEAVEFEGMYLPLPPEHTRDGRATASLGAWPHLNPEEVAEFGPIPWASANFLSVYGDVLRWVILLIASVTLAYSLAVLYILSLYEMRIKHKRARLRWSKWICVALLAVHTVTFAAAVLLRLSYVEHELGQPQTFSGTWQRILSVILYFGHASLGSAEAQTSWDQVFAGGQLIIDIQSFAVLVIGFSILQANDAAVRMTRKCHEYILKRDQEKMNMGYLRANPGILTQGLARICRITQSPIYAELLTARTDMSKPPKSGDDEGKSSCWQCGKEEHYDLRALRNEEKQFMAWNVMPREEAFSTVVSKLIVGMKEDFGLRIVEFQDGHEGDWGPQSELINMLAERFGWPGHIRKVSIHEPVTDAVHSLTCGAGDPARWKRTGGWRFDDGGEYVALAPETTSVTVCVEASTFCRLALRHPPDEAFDLVSGKKSHRLEVGRKGSKFYILADSENPNHDLEHDLEGISMMIRLCPPGQTPKAVKSRSGRQATLSSRGLSARSLSTRGLSTRDLVAGPDYVRWARFAERVASPEERKTQASDSRIGNIFGIKVGRSSPQFKPLQLLQSSFWFCLPDIISALIIFLMLKSTTTEDVASGEDEAYVHTFEYDFFKSGYLCLALVLLIQFHTSKTGRVLGKEVKRNIGLLLSWNYCHLLTQGAYLVLESVFNYPCSVTSLGLAQQELVFPADCVPGASVRRMSAFDTLLGKIGIIGSTRCDTCLEVDCSDCNPDYFGTLLGLDNGVANTGKFGLGAWLFVFINFASVLIKSPKFGHHQGGAMWYKEKAREQASRRKLVAFVERAQQSERTQLKHRTAMEFVRSMLRKMNESTGDHTSAHALERKLQTQDDAEIKKLTSTNKIVVSGAGELVDGAYYNLPNAEVNVYQPLWGNVRVWNDEHVWCISNRTAELDEIFAARQHAPGAPGNADEIKYYQCPATEDDKVNGDVPRTGWKKLQRQRASPRSLTSPRADTPRDGKGMEVIFSQCGRLESISVKLQFRFQALARWACIAKVGHLDGGYVSRALQLDELTNSDIVLLVLEAFFVHCWKFVLLILLVLHALVDHDLPSIGLLVALCGFANIQWPRINPGFWTLATVIVTFEILIRYVLNWEALELWTTHCQGSEFGFFSYCSLIDQNSSSLLIVLVLTSLLMQKDTMVRSGVWRSWDVFLQNSSHSRSAPHRCQYCKKQGLAVTSCVHELHTLSSTVDVVEPHLTDADQLPRLHLCRSCGMAMKTTTAAQFDSADQREALDAALNSPRAEAKATEGKVPDDVQLINTTFSPPRLEWMYMYLSDSFRSKIKNLFVWARWVQGKTTLVAVVNPTDAFRSEWGDRSADMEQEIRRLFEAAVQELDRRPLVAWEKWPRDLKLPSKVYVCGPGVGRLSWSPAGSAGTGGTDPAFWAGDKASGDTELEPEPEPEPIIKRQSSSADAHAADGSHTVLPPRKNHHSSWLSVYERRSAERSVLRKRFGAEIDRMFAEIMDDSDGPTWPVGAHFSTYDWSTAMSERVRRRNEGDGAANLARDLCKTVPKWRVTFYVHVSVFGIKTKTPKSQGGAQRSQASHNELKQQLIKIVPRSLTIETPLDIVEPTDWVPFVELQLMCEMQAGVLRKAQKCVRRALNTATRRARRHRDKNKVAEKHASPTGHKLSVGIIARMKTKVSGRSDAGDERPERKTHHHESGESILQPAPQQLKKGRGKGNEWTGYAATQPAVKFIEEQREEWAGGGSSTFSIEGQGGHPWVAPGKPPPMETPCKSGKEEREDYEDLLGAHKWEGRINIVEKPHPERKHSPGLQRDLKVEFRELRGKSGHEPMCSFPRLLLGVESSAPLQGLGTSEPTVDHHEQTRELARAGKRARLMALPVDYKLLKALTKAAVQAEPARADDRKEATGGPRIGGLKFAVRRRCSQWLRNLVQNDLKRDAQVEQAVKRNESRQLTSQSQRQDEPDSGRSTSGKSFSADATRIVSGKTQTRRAVVKHRSQQAYDATGADGLQSGDIVKVESDSEGAEDLTLEWRPQSIGAEHSAMEDGWQRPSGSLATQSFSAQDYSLEYLPTEKAVIVMHDFEPVRGARDLSLKFGDRVIAIDHIDKPWWLGYKVDEPDQVGEFPASYCEAAVVPPARMEASEWSISKKEAMRSKRDSAGDDDDGDGDGDAHSAEHFQNDGVPQFLRRNVVGHGATCVGIELVSLLVVCLAYTEYRAIDIGSVAGGGSSEAGSSMSSWLVFLAMLQFFFIMADRAIYHRKRIREKLILLWCSIVVYCSIIFGWFWDYNAPPGLFSYTGMLFILKCAYWYVCGLQIRYGFGASVTKINVSALAVSTSKINHYTFIAFDNIPFLSEISTTLDWLCHRTTLEWIDAIKLNRIFALVFIAQCRLARLEETGKELGQPQPFKVKLIFGTLAGFGFTALIWGPALLMTSLSQLVNYHAHNVLTASVSVDLLLESSIESAAQAGNFSVRLFESGYHSVHALSTEESQLLSDAEFQPFRSQYNAFGSGTKEYPHTGFWYGPRDKVFADQVQDILVSGAADAAWQPTAALTSRLSRYLASVRDDDTGGASAKVVTTITLVKDDGGAAQEIRFPSSFHDPWSERGRLNMEQASTLAKVLRWGGSPTDAAAKAEAGVHANATSACGAEAASNRSVPLRLMAGYPPLLFVENNGHVVPLDMRGHLGEGLTPEEAAIQTRSAALELWLEERPSAAGASTLAWRMSQLGVDVSVYSWERHCGSATGACLDGCHWSSEAARGAACRQTDQGEVCAGAPVSGSGLALSVFNAKKPDDIGQQILGLGLVGLYFTVVYTIGKILKAWTYKLMHDILYTDMEKTGYVWEKIKDIYRARALAHTFGDTTQMMNGEEINFYDIVRIQPLTSRFAVCMAVC